MDKKISKEELEKSDVFTPHFDDKGLVSAIAQDNNSGEVLMLAFMNEEAIELSLKTGIVHYFSRSRQKIWKKGETSGQTQKLIEMRVDCDQDALLLKVEQLGKGAACHTGRKSCFFRTVKGEKLIVKGKRLFNPKDVY